MCEAHDMDALAGASGSIPLVVPPDFAAMFPHLAAGFSPRQSAILLASTRLVGMICPGLHSIFSALSLDFSNDTAADSAMDYAVTRADARVRLVDIALTAPGLHGSLQTLLRPMPVAQPGFAALRALVAPDAFAGQRALVIGGARGLGEVTAKLLACGGAEVTLTYLLGADDAARIAAEAAAAGLRVATMKFDMAHPPDDAAVPAEGFTHAYYFATPRILLSPAKSFSAASFARQVDYYVTGLARCVEWLRPRAVADVCVWYPSTAFIETTPPGFGEYATAKACGEALCAQLSERLAPMRVVAERLPRLATDQTQSLTDANMQDAATTLRTALLKLM
jgi:NAD(P)-dependent dehydrogenase (short-subunit alcohol dehydrogenase family)